MVAMSVWPTDASDGAVSSEARWRKMARLWLPSGVVLGAGGNMVPSLAGTNLTVQSGACWVDGHYCELVSTQVLTTTANGLAVVRFDPAANTADLLYRDGITIPAQSPTGTFELPIAKIVASALIDFRPLAGSGQTTLWNFRNDTAVESGDITSGPVNVFSQTFSAVAGHTYNIRAAHNMITRTAAGASAVLGDLKMDGATIYWAIVDILGNNQARHLVADTTWKAAATAPATASYFLSVAGGGPAHYTINAGSFPAELSITDLGAIN